MVNRIIAISDGITNHFFRLGGKKGTETAVLAKSKNIDSQTPEGIFDLANQRKDIYFGMMNRER